MVLQQANCIECKPDDGEGGRLRSSDDCVQVDRSGVFLWPKGRVRRCHDRPDGVCSRLQSMLRCSDRQPRLQEDSLASCMRCSLPDAIASTKDALSRDESYCHRSCVSHGALRLYTGFDAVGRRGLLARRFSAKIREPCNGVFTRNDDSCQKAHPFAVAIAQRCRKILRLLILAPVSFEKLF